MNVRELLRYEIWSKETSRRIIGRIWRFLKPTLAVFGILALLLVTMYAVECSWLTSSERSAGREALVKIEELEQLGISASDRFDGENAQAKTAVAIARQKAWTLRDHWMAENLELYRWELQQMHDGEVREAQSRSFVIQKHLEWHSNPELEKKKRDLDLGILSEFRSVLHKQLD